MWLRNVIVGRQLLWSLLSIYYCVARCLVYLSLLRNSGHKAVKVLFGFHLGDLNSAIRCGIYCVVGIRWWSRALWHLDYGQRHDKGTRRPQSIWTRPIGKGMWAWGATKKDVNMGQVIVADDDDEGFTDGSEESISWWLISGPANVLRVRIARDGTVMDSGKRISVPIYLFSVYLGWFLEFGRNLHKQRCSGETCGDLERERGRGWQ